MNRRSFLALSGAGCVMSLSGCGQSSGGADDQTKEDTATAESEGSSEPCRIERATASVEPTPVTVDGALDEANARVELRWNARSQQSIKDEPDAYVGSRADEGSKYLVLRVEVTNTTDATVTIDEFNFEVEYKTPNTVGSTGSAIDGIDEIDYQVRSGGTVTGIVAFIIPADSTEAIVRPDVPNFADRIGLSFDAICDESLPMDAPTMNSESG